VTDERPVIIAVAVGAILGAAAAYLLFTPRGRRALDNIDGTLDDASARLEQFRHALRRADGVVHETRGAVDDVRAMLKGAELQTRV